MARRRVAPGVDALSILRALAGGALLAYAPGLAWTLALLPELRGLARHALAVGLSIATMTLALYVGDVALHIPITPLTAVLEAVALTAGGALVAWARRRSHAAPGS